MSECEIDFNENYCEGCFCYNSCYSNFIAGMEYERDPEYYDRQKYLVDMAEMGLIEHDSVELPAYSDLPF
ncbi:MAG: hypothetical protein K2J39_02615 [Ruminococcus sp.]|nr:hypothetical protein [Ruminococcus sp.]